MDAQAVRIKRGDRELRTEALAGGVIRVRLRNRFARWSGMWACCFQLGPILVDSGFSHLRALLLAYLEPQPPECVVLTHHHEDHSGCCGALGCPVYLADPRQRFSEGLDRLRLYRRLFWGTPLAYRPEAPPTEIRAGGRTLLPIPTPGHSRTHSAYLEPDRGTVFLGDLYLSPGVTAVMSHENPYQTIASLRRVAELDPVRAYNGHGLALERPAAALREKAERLERAAERVRALHRAGHDESQILADLFPHRGRRDHFMEWMTGGEFSQKNFVRACLAHSVA